MIHVIKIQKQYSEAVFLGEKTFEVRNNDRGYQKGDLKESENGRNAD